MKAIVVGYADTPACNVALSCASDLARRASAAVHVVSAEPVFAAFGGFGWSAPYDASRPIRERLELWTARALESIDAPDKKGHARLGATHRELTDVAEETDAGLIVVGSREHSGMERFMIGSTADRLVRTAPVPVLLARTPTCGQRIVAAADDSEFGRHAVRVACRIAAATGGSVRCVHAAVPPTDWPDARYEPDVFVMRMENLLEEFVKQTAGELPPERLSWIVRLGDPKEEVLGEAERESADLIVVGTHGRNFVTRALLGSVSLRIQREAPVSVLVVPGDATNES